MIGALSFRYTILIVDSDEQYLSSVSVLLRSNGYERVYGISDRARVATFLATTPVNVAIVSLAMPLAVGLDFVRELCRDHPEIRVIVTSNYDDWETAVECLRAGAYDYLMKAIAPERLLARINSSAEELYAKNRSGRPLKTTPVRDSAQNEAFRPIITKDKKMLNIFRYIEAIAPTTQTVLITGETGTGKELIARAVHEISNCPGEFVSINVAGLDDLMFSDTLFGHSRGAFTGADRERKGLIEKAAEGTLFLDEIGDLNNNSQVKLLRLLQEGEYYPLGSDSVKLSNARIIVATNCSLEEKMKTGDFRKDLYYRLCSHHIHLPALRERSGDIKVLVDHFLGEMAKASGSPVSVLSQDALDALYRSDFPGNIRELKGLLSNAAAVAGAGPISMRGLNLPASPEPGISSPVDFAQISAAFGRLPTLHEAEEFLICQALKTTVGNQRAAAALLGISRQALNKRLLRNPSYVVKR